MCPIRQGDSHCAICTFSKDRHPNGLMASMVHCTTDGVELTCYAGIFQILPMDKSHVEGLENFYLLVILCYQPDGTSALLDKTHKIARFASRSWSRNTKDTRMRRPVLDALLVVGGGGDVVSVPANKPDAAQIPRPRIPHLGNTGDRLF